MKIKSKVLSAALAAAMAATLLGGCAASQNSGTKEVKLDPSNPVSVTVWHYYNGAQQAAFDKLVSEFNQTEGKEQGIYVEGYTQGSVGDLEKAIQDSASGVVGAEKMPDVFSTYADTAYSVQQEGKLADISQYVSKEELDQYVDSYVQEGYFKDDGALYLFPIAKSTEIMMINKTDWEPFAKATGTTTDELKTEEGIVEVAKRYYEWTDAKTPKVPNDGKAFYGRDSMSNYFVIGMKQMGADIIGVENGTPTVNVDKDKIRRLWDDYYVPYVSGYFDSIGKFRSDDVKTGDVLAYTGSSSSAMYFPDQVVKGNKSKPIDYIVLPAPIMEGGENYAVQQGAGMAVTKTDEQHEYAACKFMEWLTEKENNIRFVCESAYLPVRKDANNIEAVDEVIAQNDLQVSPKAHDALKSVLGTSEPATYYTTKCFENSYDARKVLDYDLKDKAVADKAKIKKAIKKGASRDKALAPYLTDEAFDEWYASFSKKLTDAVQGNSK